MTPVGELRLSIPIGIAGFHLDIFSVFVVSVIGNFMPAIALLFFFRKISLFLSARSRFMQRVIGFWENRTKERHYTKIQKYGIIGLILFVATPLPMTGAWTGSLLATLMSLPLKKSIPAIFAGIFFAGITVTALVVSGINIQKYLGWQLLVGILIIAGIVYAYLKKNKY